jgi:hypothetical protein
LSSLLYLDIYGTVELHLLLLVGKLVGRPNGRKQNVTVPLIWWVDPAKPQLTLSATELSLWEIDWIIGGKDHMMGANLNKKKNKGGDLAAIL